MASHSSTTSKPTAALAPAVPYAGWIGKLLRIQSRPVIKLYHGYGDNDRLLVMGHVLLRSPEPDERYSRSVLRNALSLVRLFMVRPAPAGIRVVIRFGDEAKEVATDTGGFFAATWDTTQDLSRGWHPVTAELAADPRIAGEGKVFVPPPDGRAFVSDIDDTFLISHSANLGRRLRVLLTKNARTRMPFEGVVAHYKALSLAGTTADKPHPFFYVSSSEWNLYDYIREFCRYHELPEGVFLLSPIKSLASFWKSGQGTHSAKYDRIAGLMQQFPALQFTLLGDDSQQDPYIYLKVAQDFPGRVSTVYIRHRVKAHLARVRGVVAQLEALGVEMCYFTHSATAMKHSAAHGLI